MKTTLYFVLVLLTYSSAGAQAKNEIETINLLGDALYPEGIHALPNGDLLVGGFGDGSIQRINQTNEVSYFSEPGKNGMVIAVGMAVDKKRNQLWVANLTFKVPVGNRAAISKYLTFPMES